MSQPKLPACASPVEWIGPDHPFYPVSGLVHCVRLPAGASLSQPAPAVVLVHGWGGDETRMWVFKQVISGRTAIITPRAPIELEQGGYVWFDYAGERTRPDPDSLAENVGRLKQFVRSLPDLYPIDPARLALLGFSQGAAMVNILVSQAPELAAGAASLSGFFPTGPEQPAPTGRLAGRPIFIAHGVRDDIVPLSAARHTRAVYTRLGAAVTYGEYSVGHKANTPELNDLKEWLARVLYG